MELLGGLAGRGFEGQHFRDFVRATLHSGRLFWHWMQNVIAVLLANIDQEVIFVAIRTVLRVTYLDSVCYDTPHRNVVQSASSTPALVHAALTKLLTESALCTVDKFPAFSANARANGFRTDRLQLSVGPYRSQLVTVWCCTHWSDSQSINSRLYFLNLTYVLIPLWPESTSFLWIQVGDNSIQIIICSNEPNYHAWISQSTASIATPVHVNDSFAKMRALDVGNTVPRCLCFSQHHLFGSTPVSVLRRRSTPTYKTAMVILWSIDDSVWCMHQQYWLLVSYIIHRQHHSKFSSQ